MMCSSFILWESWPSIEPKSDRDFSSHDVLKVANNIQPYGRDYCFKSS